MSETEKDEMVGEEYEDINKLIDDVVNKRFGEPGEYRVLIRIAKPDDPEQFAEADMTIEIK